MIIFSGHLPFINNTVIDLAALTEYCCCSQSFFLSYDLFVSQSSRLPFIIVFTCANSRFQVMMYSHR